MIEVTMVFFKLHLREQNKFYLIYYDVHQKIIHVFHSYNMHRSNYNSVCIITQNEVSYRLK